jgi:hypothetical protein
MAGCVVLRRRDESFQVVYMASTQDTALPPGYEGITFEKVWATLQETAQRQQETDRQMKEQRQETDRLIRENQKLMGDLGRKFGKIIENMFIPNLKEKFNALGYVFQQAASNVFIENKEHNIYAEIDVLLENGGCVMVVEVKTQANISDIREHIERIEKVRRHFDLRGDKRKLYGALAAAILPDNVRDYALKQGLYIVRQTGDAVSIEAPQDTPRAW